MARTNFPPGPVTYRTRGYLPHFELPGAIYAVVFRLADALPPHVIAELREAKQILAQLPRDEAATLREELHQQLDNALDQHRGSAHMLHPPVADAVAQALTHFDGVRYQLYAWAVMPNHVHAVVQPLGEWTLDAITHSWKSWSANRANAVLERTGRFWQRESYDRVVRDEEELARTIEYVEGNPGKAGLTNWRWTSAGWKPALL